METLVAYALELRLKEIEYVISNLTEIFEAYGNRISEADEILLINAIAEMKEMRKEIQLMSAAPNN